VQHVLTVAPCVSDERGDRTAEERQKQMQVQSERTNERGTRARACKEERQEAKCDRLMT
jgi:hypothetical protein